MILTALLTLFILLMVLYNPVLPSLIVATLPVENKAKIILNFLEAWLKNLLTIIPDLLAPVVVPIALLFTKWEDESLPRLFKWWDNDVTINGDRATHWIEIDTPEGRKPVPVIPLEDTEEARSFCYWAPGHHPRSFYARWVWMGLRNRASKLSEMLGSRDYAEPVEVLYNENKTRLVKVKDRYRLNWSKDFGPIYFRVHYGYKIGSPGNHGGPVASGFTFKRKPKS